MPADPAGAGPPLPLPPQRNAGPGDAAALSAEEADRLHYADLPLGLANPTVLEHGTSSGELGSSLTSGRCRYLCYFLHRHLEFRLPEVESLAAMAGGTGRGSSSMSSDSGSGGAAAAAAVVWEKPFGNRPESPFWYAHLASDEVACQVAARSMLTKVLLEVWGEADSLEGLHAAVAQFCPDTKARWRGPEQSFKFVVESWGCTLTQAQQIELMEGLQPATQFKGRIDLKAPHNRFWLIVARSSGLGLPLLPERYYFGREVGAGDRSPLNRYDLPRRRYLGPTSMDTEMAFLMANVAQVRRGGLVLDPFVGTGSILVPAAHLGALTMGTDIDIRVIKIGKRDKAGQRVNIWTNFEDYKLPPPVGLLRCDLHTWPFRPDLEEVLDALICDPPYGVRAGGRKCVAKEREIRDRDNYIPSTDPYSVAECLHDLLECAARLLRLGGRLVYFFPAAPGFYSDAELAQHPTLQLVANSEQILSTRYSRRLITMQKVRPYNADEAAAYYEQRGPPKMLIDDMHEHVYKRGGDLAAEGGLTLAELRAAQVSNMPKNRGKNI